MAQRPPVSGWIWVLVAVAVIASAVAWILVLMMRVQLVAVVEETARTERWFAVVTAADARVAMLIPTPSGAPDLRGRATYDPGTQSAVFVFENLIPPAGQRFVLWAIRGPDSSSLGEIRTDESGYAVTRLDVAGGSDSLDAFSVSLEEAGDAPVSDAPTGSVVMLGALER
jgi:anti-sigma-K factor RskA